MAKRVTGKAAHNDKVDEVRIAKRRTIVAANLLSGANYRDIADQLGISMGTVSGDVRALLKMWQKDSVETVENYVTLQQRRLAVMLNAIWDRVREGDLSAMDRALRIMEREAQLLGLDAPSKSRIVDKDDHDVPLVPVTMNLIQPPRPPEKSDDRSAAS